MSENTSAEKVILLNEAPLPKALDEEIIRTVVHRFYAAIRDDDLLGPIFNGSIAADEWPAHLARMCDFWSATLLRTSRYGGRPLRPHLGIPGLGEEHFRRWLKLFRKAVREACPPEVGDLFMDRAVRIAHSFRLAVAFNRGENAIGIHPITEASL